MALSPPASTVSPAHSRRKRIARAKAILQATVLGNKWIPSEYRDKLSAKQAEFLVCEAREALYGGAAGGGKSFSLLMAALQYVDEPGYHALILRRTYKQLAKADSIMATSHEWLGGLARWNGDDHKWTFPSGATLEFGHMEHEKDKHNYQGAAFHFVGWDELTQFEESPYLYLFSRQRRKGGSRIPIRTRSGSNPGGVGHEWVKSRFGIGSAEGPPDGRCFIPAKLDDNVSAGDGSPNIDADDYRKALAELDPVTRAQLEAGDWDAIASGRFDGVALRRHRYRIVDTEFGRGQGAYLLLADGKELQRVQIAHCSRFLTCDPAASDEPLKKGSDPDYTVICVWAQTPDLSLVWLDCHRFRLEIPDILPQVQSVYSQWDPQFVAIEAVASNRAVFQQARRTGMVVRELNPRGQNKLMRAAPAMTKVAQGKVWLPEKAHWLDQAVAELLIFKGDGKTHDDVVDNLSYACTLLDELDQGGSGGRPIPLNGRHGWR